MKIKRYLSLFMSVMLVTMTVLVFQGCDLFEKTEYIEKDWNETFEFEGIEFTFERYEFENWAWHGSYEADSNKVWLLIYVYLF